MGQKHLITTHNIGDVEQSRDIASDVKLPPTPPTSNTLTADSSPATSEMSEYAKPHADLSAWGKKHPITTPNIGDVEQCRDIANSCHRATFNPHSNVGTSRAMSCFAAIREGHKTKKAAGLCSLPEGGGYLLSHFRSTIGVAGFNFSVRNGKRWNPRAITTLIFFVTGTPFSKDPRRIRSERTGSCQSRQSEAEH